MKRVWILSLIAVVLLFGCSRPVYETVGDEYVMQPPAEKLSVSLTLPDDAAEAAIHADADARLYLCDGYEVVVQTLAVGSLDRALRSVTGFGEESLTVMKTRDVALDRYDCVWASAGEGGEQVGRLAVLDDGNYYYCVSVMADSAVAWDLSSIWQQILDSVTLG